MNRACVGVSMLHREKKLVPKALVKPANIHTHFSQAVAEFPRCSCIEYSCSMWSSRALNHLHHNSNRHEAQ